MNKMYYCKKAILIPAVITIMVAGGCSSDDDNDEMPSGAVALKFQVSETPLEYPEAPTASTRTKETTTASFSSFYYHYVIGSNLSGLESATKVTNDGLWTSTSGWPNSADDNTPVPFYAYANTDANTDAQSSFYDKENNKIYLNFTVDETTYETKDFLVATAMDTKSHSQGVIGFQFSHACGALRFSLNKTSSLSDYTVMVNTVKIYNIPCSGTYCFNDKSWALDTNPTLMEFTIKSYEDNNSLPVGTDKEYLSEENNYLFLIPQTLTPWNKNGAPADAYVEIKCKIHQNGIYKVGTADSWGTAYLPLNITIEPGKIHPINISMGTALRDEKGKKYFNLTN